MRIHRPLAQEIVSSLLQIFKENQQADKVVERTLKQNTKWGARDRHFVAENIYDIIRWWRLLQFCTNSEDLKFVEIRHFWPILGAWLLITEHDLPEWPEFEGLDKNTVLDRHSQAQSIRPIRESIPDWLDELGQKQIPNWEAELTALNQRADLYIRVNTLKTTKENLIATLAEEGLETEPVEGVKSALRVLNKKKLTTLISFKKGLFEVQDAGSQLIVNFLEARPGMQVIDACAGAGGKTLALAAEMNNEGSLLAFDVHSKKMEELIKRAGRNDIRIVKTQKINGQTVQNHQAFADRILLDVPCSGLGVLKRKPDAKWKLDLSFLNKIQNIQSEIIHNYSSMLRPGGKLVYATCSILQSENQEQVAKFLSGHSAFELEEECFISPSLTGFDGFYMARLLRKA